MEKFTFTTKTDYGVFRDYWLFTLLEKPGNNGKKSKFVRYIAVLGTICAAAAVLWACSALAFANALGILPLILLIGFGAALVSALVTALYTQPKAQYKLVREAVEKPQKYRFTEAEMEVREDIPEENRESLAVFPYEKLVSCWETEKAFYLFISETEAFLIPKDQLADAAQLADFLARKLEGKYFKDAKR